MVAAAKTLSRRAQALGGRPIQRVLTALAGLSLVRISLELAGWPWGLAALPLLPAGALLGPRLRGPSRLLPVLPALYLLYPSFGPWLGLRLLLWAVLAALLLQLSGPRPGWLPPAVALAALAVYLRTLIPGPLPADSGEFQVVAATLGVAHPPGYPLYTLLAHLWTYLPVADPATRVSLFSSLAAAATLGVVAAAAPTGGGALLAAATLAAVPTFWTQAVTANVRSLTALLAALLLALALRPGAPSGRRMIVAAGTAALALGHHPSLIAVVLPAGILLARRARRPPLLALAGAFLLGLLPLAYLPLRSAMQPAFDPVPIRSVGGFLGHVLARGFRGDLVIPGLDQLPDRLGVLGQIVGFELGPWLAAAALLGLLAAGSGGLVLASTFLIIAGLALSYRAPQTVEYLMPGWVALALAVGWAPGAVATAMGRVRRRLAPTATPPAVAPRSTHGPDLAAGAGALVGAALLLAALARLAWLYPNMLELRATEPSGARALLAEAPRGATVLSSWHLATPLWYLQLVEGTRPDLEVHYVYPEGATPYPQTWLRRVREGLARGPVVVTNRYAVFGELQAVLTPAGPGYRVLPSLPEAPRGAVFGDRLALEPLGAPQEVRAGQDLPVDLALSSVGLPDPPLATFVHLVGPDGRPVAQKDLTHVLSPGARLVARHSLPVPYTVGPGSYRLIAGAYLPLPEGWQRLRLPDGRDHLVLGAVQVRAARWPPATLHPAWRPAGQGLLIGRDAGFLHWAAAGGYTSQLWQGEPVPGPVRGPWGLGQGRLDLPQPPGLYVPFAGKLTLVGAAYERDGDRLRVRLAWLGGRPLWGEYTVSVKAVGPDWAAQHDGTPLSGMVPTTKWLRGARFQELHLLELPPQAGDGGFRLTLSVYDAFSLEQLPILDPRLAEAGQGEVLVLAEVP